jgi:hypothetical protein
LGGLRIEDAGQFRDDLVGAGLAPCPDLLQRVAPPLQAHLGDHRLLGDPGGAGDLHVEGVEGEEDGARLGGGRQGREEAVGVGAFDEVGAGGEAHAGRARTRR